MDAKANPADKHLSSSALHARFARSRGPRRMRYAAEIERREIEGEWAPKYTAIVLTPAQRGEVVFSMARRMIGSSGATVGAGAVSSTLARLGLSGFPTHEQITSWRAAAAKRYAEEMGNFARGASDIG